MLADAFLDARRGTSDSPPWQVLQRTRRQHYNLLTSCGEGAFDAAAVPPEVLAAWRAARTQKLDARRSADTPL